MRKSCLVLLVLLLAGTARAQTLVLYDDGLDHVLSSYAEIPDPDGARIEVRDGPGADPTTLDVTIAGDLYDLYFDAYDHSDLELLGALGYAHVTAYDDATVRWLTALGYSTSVAARGRSVVETDWVAFASASEQSTFSLGGADRFEGRGSSATTATGTIYAAQLYDSATLHMTRGVFGFDSGSVHGDAYLLVDGSGGVGGAYGFSVSGNGRADVHSGSLATGAPLFSVGVSDFGLVRLFGEDWAIDDVPVGFGDIAVEPGQTTRSGRLTGTLASGDPVDTDFTISGNGILRLVPEPGTGLQLGVGVAFGLGIARTRVARRRGRA